MSFSSKRSQVGHSLQYILRREAIAFLGALVQIGMIIGFIVLLGLLIQFSMTQH